MTTAPTLVRMWNPLASWLLRRGVPLGPNTVLTARGRSTGLPRTAPVAVANVDGRRYVIGAYGEVHWVRNLRAAGEASVRIGGRDVRMQATELDQATKLTFFREQLPRYWSTLPFPGRVGLRVLFSVAAPDVLADPARAAARLPVFRLDPA